MLGSCFVLQYFVSFLVVQPSRWGRESWLLYVCCVLNVMSLLWILTLPRGAIGLFVVCDVAFIGHTHFLGFL